MKKYILFICITLCAGVGFSSCTQKADLEAEKDKVKRTVDNFETFWETEDTLLLANLFDHDAHMVNYGADSSEVFIGWTALRNSLVKMLPDFDQTKVTISHQIIHVSPAADAAWFSEVMDWHLLLLGKPAHLKNQRVTGVLEKKDGRWVIVQFHVSIPLSGSHPIE